MSKPPEPPMVPRSTPFPSKPLDYPLSALELEKLESLLSKYREKGDLLSAVVIDILRHLRAERCVCLECGKVA